MSVVQLVPPHIEKSEFSSEMSGIRCLLQSLQPEGFASPAAITQVDQGGASSRIEDESPNSPFLSCQLDLDVHSTSVSELFHDNSETVDGTVQPSLGFASVIKADSVPFR